MTMVALHHKESLKQTENTSNYSHFYGNYLKEKEFKFSVLDFSLVRQGWIVSNQYPTSDVITQISMSNIQGGQCQHDGLTHINSVAIYSFQIVFHSSQLNTWMK